MLTPEALAARKEAWPAQYYASYDIGATQPVAITGWFDVWNMGDVSSVPAADKMLALTDAQWAARLVVGQGVKDGAIVAFSPPAPVISLQEQARNALSQASNQTWTRFGMFGQTPSPAWIAYVTALRAIADGTDTATTVLPDAPATTAS